VSHNPFSQLKGFIQSKDWYWKDGKPIPYGEQIVITSGTHQATVNFYPKRGKMITGGSESPLKMALQSWIDTQIGEKPVHTQTTFLTPHIGMDESGKGDWFGPLVVAAVAVDQQMICALEKQGVRDSKTLESSAIQRIASAIERIVPLACRHVQVIEPLIYNDRYNRCHNINLLLAEVYAEVAAKVWQATRSSLIVCDQFSQRADRLEQTFAAHYLPRPIQQTHAESASIAVAAASILASAAFTTALEQLGHEAGLIRPLPKGASDITVLQATLRQIITLHGFESAGRYAKLHFKPIEAIVQPYRCST